MDVRGGEQSEDHEAFVWGEMHIWWAQKPIFYSGRIFYTVVGLYVGDTFSIHVDQRRAGGGTPGGFWFAPAWL